MDKQKLFDTLDGLIAFDVGAIDSGISDEALKRQTFDFLRELSQAERDALVEEFCAERFLSEMARADGYSEEDAGEFRAWVTENL